MFTQAVTSGKLDNQKQWLRHPMFMDSGYACPNHFTTLYFIGGIPSPTQGKYGRAHNLV